MLKERDLSLGQNTLLRHELMNRQREKLRKKINSKLPCSWSRQMLFDQVGSYREKLENVNMFTRESALNHYNKYFETLREEN